MGATPKWTPKRILCEIHERGMTLEKLAEMNDRNPASFRHVWKRPNAINEKIISDFLGVSAEQLWPERYPKDSHRIFDSKKYGRAEGQKAVRVSDRVAA
jgi:Ner family transcriptional regulator